MNSLLLFLEDPTMLTQNQDKNRHQLQMFCMDDLVPQNHLLRLIDSAIDWSFIYDLVKEKYSPDFGRPSLDPVVLIKIPFIQYLYGIRSMRQTMIFQRRVMSFALLRNRRLPYPPCYPGYRSALRRKLPDYS